jgi:hypothetical protein
LARKRRGRKRIYAGIAIYDLKRLADFQQENKGFLNIKEWGWVD